MSNEVEQEQDLDCFQTCQLCCGSCCGFLYTWLPCCFFCFIQYPYITVTQSNEGLLEVFGKYKKTLAPGMHFINRCVEEVKYVSKKTLIQNLTRQVVLTKDNITLTIDASVYYKIIDAYKSIYKVQDVHEAVKFHTFATLRNVCGQHTLQEFMEKKNEVTAMIKMYVDQQVDNWGIEVSSINIKDIILSQELQQTLSSAAQERRLAQSKIISAQADVESAKLMRDAADILNSNSAMQIRFLETLQTISKQDNQKIIFLPLEEGNKSSL